MTYIVLYMDGDRHIARLFPNAGSAVRLLLDLSNKREWRKIVYGVDEVVHDKGA